MDEAKVVAHSVERFGVAEEQISVGQEVVIEVLDHAAFGRQIEIDENVAAEDNVQVLHEGHARIVGQVQTVKGDAGAGGGLDLELFAHGGEIFLPVIRGQVPRAIGA